VAGTPPTPTTVSPPTVKREPETVAPSSAGEQRPAKRARPAPTTSFVDLTLDETEDAPPIKPEPLHIADGVAVTPRTEAHAPISKEEDEEDLEGELKRIELQRQRIENEAQKLETEQRLRKLRRA